MDTPKCSMCHMDTKGYKCPLDGCEAVSATHDETHVKDGHDCLPMCGGCNEAETKCTCS